MKHIALLTILVLVLGCSKSKDTEPKTPLIVKLERIRLISWPALAPDGTGWDFFDGPDIYIRVLQNGAEVFKSSVASNAVHGSQTITVNHSITLPAVGSFFEIEIWDKDDFDADDFMCSVIAQGWSKFDGDKTAFTYTSGTGCTIEVLKSFVY